MGINKNNSIIYSILDRFKFFGLRKIYYISITLINKVGLKIIYNSQDTLTNKFTSKNIIKHFGGDEGHNLDADTSFLGYGLLHYSIIRNIKPNRVLCIGSRKGFIPAVCALACQENQKGKVDFVDASYDDSHPKHWGGKGFWTKIIPEDHFSMLNLSSYINTYVMTSKDFANKYKERHYQYIYIDADHSYEGVKSDYEHYWPKLDKNGFMVFHDVVVKNYKKLKGFGVWKFWNELSNNKKIIFPIPKHSGLGIVQK